MLTNKDFGNRLKMIRIAMDLEKQELTTILNDSLAKKGDPKRFTARNIYEYEAGMRNFTLDFVDLFCQATNADVKWFFTENLDNILNDKEQVKRLLQKDELKKLIIKLSVLIKILRKMSDPEISEKVLSLISTAEGKKK